MFPIVRWGLFKIFFFLSLRESVNLHLDDESGGKKEKAGYLL